MPRLLGMRRWVGVAAVTLVLIVLAWLARPHLGRWLSDRSLAAGQTDDAILWLERLAPGDARLDYLKAGRERRAGNLAAAASLVESARQKGHPADRCLREQVLIDVQGGNLAAAAPYLAELMRSPKSELADTYDALSQGYLLNLRISDASAMLRDWAAAFPQDHRPLVVLARIENESANLAAAEQLLRAAMQLSSDGQIRLHLGEVLLSKGQAKEAQLLFDEGQASDPQRALLGQAKCLRSLQHPQEARKALQQVLDKDPRNVDALAEMGRIEVDAASHASALPWLERASKAQPWNRPVQLLLISSLRATGRAGDADAWQARADAAQKALARGSELLSELTDHPYDPEIRYELGEITLEHDDPREAVVWLNSVLQLAPRHEKARDSLARARAAVKALNRTD